MGMMNFPPNAIQGGQINPKPEKPIALGQPAEREFLKNFKAITGYLPFTQYKEIDTAHGKVRALAYDLGDKEPYVPYTQGGDLILKNPGLANRIPTDADVVRGLYIPGNIAAQQSPIIPADGTQANPDYGQNVPPETTALQGPPPADPTPVDQTQMFEGGTTLATAPPIAMPGQLSPEEIAKLSPDQKYEYFLNLVKQPDSRVAQAGQMRENAAGTQREIVSPKVTLESAAPLLIAALLAGDQGGQVIQGGAQGIDQATQQRQAKSDIAIQTAREKLMAGAQNLDNQVRDQNMGDAQALAGYKELTILADKDEARNQRAAIAMSRVAASISNNQRTQMAKLSNSPQQLFAWASTSKEEGGLGLSPEEALSVSQATPKMILQLSQANYNDTRTKDSNTFRPLKARLMEVQADQIQSSAYLNDMRSAAQETLNKLDTAKLASYPQEEALKIKNMKVATDKAMAEVAAIREKNFYGNGRPRNSYQDQTNNLGKFNDLIDKATAEMTKKFTLKASMQSELTKLTEAESTQNPKAKRDFFQLMQEGAMKKGKEMRRSKLQDAVNGLDADIAGLNVTITHAQNNIDTITNVTASKGEKAKDLERYKKFMQQKTNMPEAVVDQLTKYFQDRGIGN